MPVYTTKNGEEFITDNPRHIAFINDMQDAGIPWRTYSGRGMYGKECPAVSVGRSSEFDEEDVIRATTVKGLRRDALGLGLIIYTG